MGLLDKVRNLFTEPEEPEEEIKIEQIKREVNRVPVDIKSVETRREKTMEIPVNEDFTEEISVKKEEELSKPEKKKTPIFFTENDFADLEPEKPKKIEKKKEIEIKNRKIEDKKTPYSGGGYSSTSILTKEKPSFKPTPIISPIYGILDKNYSKDDIVERKDVGEKESKTTDKVDQIRDKAYGSLEGDLKNSLYEKRKIERKSRIEEEIDLFDELENEVSTNSVKLEDTTELAKTVNEQEKNIRELEEITMDLTKELDNLLLKKENYNKNSKKEIQELIDDEEPLTENELFNLIDSMYEEGKG